MKKLFGSRLKIILLLSVILVSIIIIIPTTIIIINNSHKHYTMKITGLKWDWKAPSNIQLLSLKNVKIPNTSKTLKNSDIFEITDGYIVGEWDIKLKISGIFPFKKTGVIGLTYDTFDFSYDQKNTNIIIKGEEKSGLMGGEFKGESLTIKLIA